MSTTGFGREGSEDGQPGRDSEGREAGAKPKKPVASDGGRG
jgi:hypothetical protein